MDTVINVLSYANIHRNHKIKLSIIKPKSSNSDTCNFYQTFVVMERTIPFLTFKFSLKRHTVMEK